MSNCDNYEKWYCISQLYNMNNSSAFAENPLFSPLLRNGQQSPYLSPFPTHIRRHSVDQMDLLGFNLEDPPVQVDQAIGDRTQQMNREISDRLIHTEMQLDMEQSQLQESPLNINPPRLEAPSTNFPEISEEIQPPPFLLSSETEEVSQIQAIINYLITYSKLPQEHINQEAERTLNDNQKLKQIFLILAQKFRKLRKTKEQMVKYCIRKAFKYVTQLNKKSSKSRDLDYSMKQYFAESNTQFSFSIPFKKNSSEKTMNGSFLRRIFSCNKFSQDYKLFIDEFKQLMHEDNRKKIRYLAEVIGQALKEDSLTKIEKMKRLPWTLEILDETNQLALDLAQKGGQGIGRRRSSNH